jgi:hypothetical protein
LFLHPPLLGLAHPYQVIMDLFPIMASCRWLAHKSKATTPEMLMQLS